MKKVVILLGAMAALFCVFTYGVGYLFFHQTKISDEEILIGRIGTVPLSRTKYTVNLETGDEEITRHSFFGQLCTSRLAQRKPSPHWVQCYWGPSSQVSSLRSQ